MGEDNNELLLETFERPGGWLQSKLVEYRGEKRFDVRLFIETENGDGLIPTKKGVQIGKDEMVAFYEAVGKAVAMMGLATEEETTTDETESSEDLAGDTE